MNRTHDERVYGLISEFIEAVNSEDRELLVSRFNVTGPMLEEIYESLDVYFGTRPVIGLAPLHLAFAGEIGSRSFIDIFEMHDQDTFGIECVIWVNGMAEEPILHMELAESDNLLNLRYRYIGS